MCETCLRSENMYNLNHPNGYLRNFVFRNKRRKKGRLSGGILVYCRSALNKVLSVFDKSNENILWIKIGKNPLNNKINTHLACLCNNTKNSTYNKENECNVSKLMEKQLPKFSEPDQIIRGGNVASRIGTKLDSIVDA